MFGNEIFKTVSNKKHNSDLPIVAVTQDKGVALRDDIDYKISVSEKSVSTYKIVEKGDFVISLRSFQGGIEYSDVTGICSPAYTILKPIHPIVDKFYKFYLKQGRYISKLNERLEGIRDGKNISFENFSIIPLPYPALDEQNKIANFLSLLDERIQTQNKIIEKLESLIRGLKNRLFSECFDDDKLIPLKDISSVINRKDDGKADYPIMMITAESGFINQKERYENNNAGSSLAKYTLLKHEELAYNRGSSKSKKYGSVFYLNVPNALIPYVYHSFSMNSQTCEAKFYAYLLNSKLLDKELRKVISSTARMDGLLNISKQDFFSIKIPLPKLEKQKLISAALSDFDQCINLEKDIMTGIQKQKQYLLNQLFI